MKFADFQNILSPERLNRYVAACDNDTRKAMSLYRLNLHLSQEVFTLLSCFEVALRNAIDRELTSRFGENWLRDSVLAGGIFDIASCRDSARIITKAFNRPFCFGIPRKHRDQIGGSTSRRPEIGRAHV